MGLKRFNTNRFAGLIATVLVLAFSLALLTYVGYGEARRIYPRFEIARLVAQGELVKNSLEQLLQSNLPLKQFPGFSTLTGPVLDSDDSIAAIYVTDSREQLVFFNSQDLDESSPPPVSEFQPASQPEANSSYQVTENEVYYRVSLPLKSKFEKAGELHLLLPKEIINDNINSRFFYVGLAALGLLLCYALYMLVKARSRQPEKTARWMAISYGITFFLMAVVVVIALVNLYSSGIQGKTRALAESLSERLNVPLELGLEIKSFDKLDQTFKNYQRLNPDLSFVALTQDNRVVIHTDPAQVGTQWQSQSGYFQYDVTLEQAPGQPRFEVHLGIPTSVVYGQLWQSVKNFIALFVASLLLSILFFNLINAFNKEQGREPTPQRREEFQLRLIAPFYFMIVFADALTNSFLPQHFRELALSQQLDPALVSTLFTVYFASYALALVFTNMLSEKHGLKPLFLAGTLLSATELLSLAFVQNFYAMFVVQALAGLGQGIAFIGVQSYILKVASGLKRTRSAAIIVFGYNGGVLSAVAIGGLLAADPAVGRQGVFITGAIIALAVFLYAALLIPRKLVTAEEVELVSGTLPAEEIETLEPTSNSPAVKIGLWGELGRAFTDLRFIKVAFLMGIPTKVVMAGLITATLPLLLAQQKYQTEDIAQLIMIYSTTVLISSRLISVLADKTGQIGLILFLGILLSGVGLILIGLLGWNDLFAGSWPFLMTLLLIAGLVALGLSHGCIQAPVVSYVANTSTAGKLGKSGATSLYRLFERVGNIGGPVIISQLLLFSNGSLSAISLLGLILLCLGILFALRLPKSFPLFQRA